MGTPYIKVHESEIADDYPLPTQYTAEDEEIDELLLCDEVCDCSDSLQPLSLDLIDPCIIISNCWRRCSV